MVFIGGWRRRRGYDWYDDGVGYRPRSRYGRDPRRGNSLLRDMCLLESGCCLAEAIGCGPQLVLLSPTLLRQSWRAVGTRPDVRVKPARRVDCYASRSPSRVVSTADQPAAAAMLPLHTHVLALRGDSTAAALRRHGLRRGGCLTARRLLRCRPGATGGNDPVPMSLDTRQIP